jgi:lysophospholipase L1-like esterase
MSNNANEGHPGALIDEIANFAKLSLPQRPNIILMMAGTNDMATGNRTASAPDRLGKLIDECIGMCPDAVVLVAKLTPASDSGLMERIKTFNGAVDGVVNERMKKGAKVTSVDMLEFLTAADLQDGLHPNDGGYEKMATAWFSGLQRADDRGWITEPV